LLPRIVVARDARGPVSRIENKARRVIVCRGDASAALSLIAISTP
jgi:hypothetical protein